jgi:uncharacterized protein involved in outer membrane biogenesis
MKKTLIAVGGILALIVGAVLVGPGLIDWNAYKSEITAAVETAIGRKLSIDGDLTFAVLPTPALSASGVRLANVDGAEAPDLLRIKDVRIRVSINELFQGRIAVEQVTLVEPVIALEMLPDGRTSWDLAPKLDGGAPGVSESSGVGDRDSGVAISLASLTVTDGVLSFRDGERSEKIEQLNAEVAATSLSGPFTVTASALVYNLPLKATLRSGRIKPGQPIGLSATVEVEGLDAQAAFDGTLAEPGPDLAVSGKLKVKSGDAAATVRRLSKTSLPGMFARKFSIGADITASVKSLAVNGIEARLGNMAATGAVNATLGETPNIDVALAMTKFDLDDFFTTTESAEKAAPPSANKVSSTPNQQTGSSAKSSFALPQNLNASLDMSVDVVQYNGGVVRQVGLRAILSNGSITLDRASALLPGGSDVSLFGFLQSVDGKPQFEGDVAAASDNLRAALDWLSIDTKDVSKDLLRGFSYASKIRATPQDVEVTDINIRLDASTMTGALALALRERPGIGLRLAIDRINLDRYFASKGGAKSNVGSPKAQNGVGAKSQARTAKKGSGNLSVFDTFDANFDFQIDRLTAQGANIRALQTDGLLVGGDLTLRRMSIVDALGFAANLSGDVRDLASAPSYTINFDVSNKDTSKIFRWLGAKPPVPPKALGRVSAKGVAKGNFDAVSIKAKLAAAKAKISMDGSLQGLTGAPQIDMRVQIDHPDTTQAVRLFAPEYKPAATKLGALSSTFQVVGTAAALDVTGIEAAFGPVSVNGNLSTTLEGPRPYVKAALETSDVLLDLFLPASKPVDTARNRQRRANGLSPTSATTGGRSGAMNPRWSHEKIDLSGAKLIDADVELAMKGLSLDRLQFIQPRLVLHMQNGSVNVKSFKATILGGAVSGAGVLDASGTSPKISAALQARDIDAGTLFQLLEAPARLTGPVTLEFSGGAVGASQADLIASLNGAGRLSGRVQVQVNKNERSAVGVLNIASALFGKKVKELGQVGDVSNVLYNAFGQKPAKLTGDITIQNGVASTKNGRLAGAGAHALITGAVDLPQWRINSRASMFQDGGNASVIFADITGSLDSPNIKPGGNVLRRNEPSQPQANPLQQVLPGLLGGNGSKEKPKAGDLIKGLLKGLGG